MNYYHLLLEMIWIRSHPTSLYRVMESLGTAVVECGTAIEKVSKSGNDEYLDHVIDEETGVVENLIGAAFVSCQAEITAVVSYVKRIHEAVDATGRTLNNLDRMKSRVMKLGSPLIGQTQYTEIQVINAFANYFKHNDEWDTAWDQLPAREKQTTDVLLAAGAEEHSTGNLSAGAQALGIDSSELHLLAKCVEKWSSAVHKAYEHELKQIQLL